MIFFILSFFVGYILSLGLVRLRNIRFSARAGAHIECSSRSCAEDVTIRDVIKAPVGKWDWDTNDVMPGRNGLGFLVILKKKNNELRPDTGRDKLIFELLWQFQLWPTGCAKRCWVRWNSQDSKNCVYISPRVEKLKVEKS